jgi:hypothetical protein
MPYIVKDTTGKEFPKLPLPEAGTTQAVCCAVWILGEQLSSFKNEDGSDKYQHKIIIAWEITEKINAPESEYHGKPYMLNKKYTLSLGDKANLRKDLESWRGCPFSADELQNGFDIEKLYGVNCLIGIKHEADRNDKTKIYANVTSILPPIKGSEKLIPLRKFEDAPPKWVVSIQEKARDLDDVPPYEHEYDEASPDIGDGENVHF